MIYAGCTIYIIPFIARKKRRIVAARLRSSQFKRGLIVYKISKRAKACLLIHTAKKTSHVWHFLAKGYAIIRAQVNKSAIKRIAN